MQGETMKKEYDFYKGDEKGDDWIVLTLKLPQPAPVTLSISPKWPSSEWFEK
jgi:Ni,Fe-hydrogenase III component G